MFNQDPFSSNSTDSEILFDALTNSIAINGVVSGVFLEMIFPKCAIPSCDSTSKSFVGLGEIG